MTVQPSLHLPGDVLAERKTEWYQLGGGESGAEKGLLGGTGRLEGRGGRISG